MYSNPRKFETLPFILRTQNKKVKLRPTPHTIHENIFYSQILSLIKKLP